MHKLFYDRIPLKIREKSVQKFVINSIVIAKYKAIKYIRITFDDIWVEVNTYRVMVMLKTHVLFTVSECRLELKHSKRIFFVLRAGIFFSFSSMAIFSIQRLKKKKLNAIWLPYCRFLKIPSSILANFVIHYLTNSYVTKLNIIFSAARIFLVMLSRNKSGFPFHTGNRNRALVKMCFIILHCKILMLFLHSTKATSLWELMFGVKIICFFWIFCKFSRKIRIFTSPYRIWHSILRIYLK